MKRKILLAALFSIALLERIVFDLGPNIELVTTAMLLSAAYLGRNTSFWLTLLIMAITDLIIGNTNIFLFTWSGFLIPALILPAIFEKDKLSGVKKVGLGIAGGTSSNFFFFLWTNFGVWLLDSWKMYPDNLPGLIMSYINGLPFLKYQLTSTLGFAPLGFLLTELAIYLNQKYQFVEKFNQGFSPKFKVI